MYCRHTRAHAHTHTRTHTLQAREVLQALLSLDPRQMGAGRLKEGNLNEVYAQEKEAQVCVCVCACVCVCVRVCTEHPT